MKYKILEVGADGLLSFTKEELEALLEETYNAGYEDGRKTCQYPYWIGNHILLQPQILFIQIKQ